MKYAINFDENKRNCFAEVDWNDVNPPWTEELLTNNVYQCKIVECPYADAQLTDFKKAGDTVIFDEMLYQNRKEERRKYELRMERYSLLNAFDKYKSNILIGIENDITMSDEVLNWYQRILDLDEEAIHNPPERIKYYL